MNNKEFLKIMYDIYLKDKENFIMDTEVNSMAFREYKIDGLLNETKHFKLLEEIINKLYYEELSNNYYDFLKDLLFTILEENSISLTYKLNDSNLRNILSLLDRKLGPNLFYRKGHGITLSNTQIHILIDKLIKLKREKNYSNFSRKKNYSGFSIKKTIKKTAREIKKTARGIKKKKKKRKILTKKITTEK